MTRELPPEVLERLGEHLDAVEKALVDAGRPQQQRRAAIDDLETRIKDLLAARATHPELSDLEAVLKEIEPLADAKAQCVTERISQAIATSEQASPPQPTGFGRAVFLGGIGVVVAIALMAIVGGMMLYEPLRQGLPNKDARRARIAPREQSDRLDQKDPDLFEARKSPPASAPAYIDRGIVYAWNGDFENAIADFTEAIRLDPKLALAYTSRASAHSGKGDVDEAIADLTEAIRLEPTNVGIYIARARVYDQKGDFDKAIADFTEVIQLEPKNGTYHVARAFIYDKKGDFEKAVADYVEAIRINPNDPFAYNDMAWILATCVDARIRDGRKATENAIRANELSGGKEASIVDTLAAAYAENGEFEKARQWQAKAVKLSTERAERRELRARLELYKQDKPYRQESK